MFQATQANLGCPEQVNLYFLWYRGPLFQHWININTTALCSQTGGLAHIFHNTWAYFTSRCHPTGQGMNILVSVLFKIFIVTDDSWKQNRFVHNERGCSKLCVLRHNHGQRGKKPTIFKIFDKFKQIKKQLPTQSYLYFLKRPKPMELDSQKCF